MALEEGQEEVEVMGLAVSHPFSVPGVRDGEMDALNAWGVAKYTNTDTNMQHREASEVLQ